MTCSSCGELMLDNFNEESGMTSSWCPNIECHGKFGPMKKRNQDLKETCEGKKGEDDE